MNENNENIDTIFDLLDNLRSGNEITYSAYSLLHNQISFLFELLNELKTDLEDLEKKYTALLNERISDLIEENAKLNAEMNQAISERSIHTVDRG